MMEYFLDAIKEAIKWVGGFAESIINPILQPIADKIPDCSIQATEVIQFLGFLNSWFPLTEGVALIVIYYTILLLFIIVKTLLKFVFIS